MELEAQLRAKQDEMDSVMEESHTTIEEQVQLRILAQSQAQQLQQQIYVMRGEHAQKLEALSEPEEVPEHVQATMRNLEATQSELAATQGGRYSAMLQPGMDGSWKIYGHCVGECVLA